MGSYSVLSRSSILNDETDTVERTTLRIAASKSRHNPVKPLMRRDLDDISAIYDHCERHSKKIKKKVRRVNWIAGLSLLAIVGALFMGVLAI